MQPPSTGGRRLLRQAALRLLLSLVLAIVLVMPGIDAALAHAVAEGDKGYIKEITGVNLLPFVYLGAKHMVTGYDHILFLFGVIFFLYRIKHIGLYVSLFALGHILLGQLEGFLQIVGLVQRLGKQGIAEVSEVGLFRAAK